MREHIKSIRYNLGHWLRFKEGYGFLAILIGIVVFYIFLKAIVLNQSIFVASFYFDIGLDFILALLVAFFVIFVEGIYESFAVEHPLAKTFLKQTDHDLKILGMTLNSLHKEKGIVDTLALKFNEEKNTYKFRFLLLNPCSAALRERGNIEKKDHNLLRIECAKSVKNLDEILEKVKEKVQNRDGVFEYRFYNILPSHGLIITDKTGWMGPFYNNPGTLTKWFQINNYQAYSQYDMEFEEIWNLKGKEIKGKKTDSPEILCFSKEELEKKYPETEKLFLISKYIPINVFDNVLLEQRVIPKEVYDQLVTFSEFRKANPHQITDKNFQTSGSNEIIFKMNEKTQYTIDFSKLDKRETP